MKTLKKTLCLVLAVVLAVGVMVIPAYAETDSYNGFTDKDDVDYKYEEALATLTGMGIFNGKSSTNAAPKAYLTRAEAVTLIARALLGEGSWTLPKAPTQFTDVPADHFASGYVAYATEQGIVAGKSHTTFAPNDYVTGYELSKMLLVATGIKTDFTSAKWQMESGPLASQKGLLVGLEGVTDLNKWFTREEAAQIIWNAVKYSETLSFVVTDPTKKDYTVKFPEDSIGGRVFGLTAHYSYDNPSTGVDSDVFNRPNVEWSNGKTGAEREVYSNITQRPLVQFYAGQNLLVSDLRAKLGMSVSSAKGLTFKVFVDGSTASESSGTLQHLDDTTPGGKSVFLNTPPEGTRGATVSIYPGISGATYDVYVIYPYASYLKATDVNAALNQATLHYGCSGTNTWTGNITVTKNLMKAKDVVTFNVSNKSTTPVACNMKDEAPALVGRITNRNNDATAPYVRIERGEPLYFSAKAIIVDRNGDVSPINYSKAVVSKNDYYKVWLDNDGNILALVWTEHLTAVDFDDYGYVLEFSSKAGTKGQHYVDMTYNQDVAPKTAEAKVLMVSLKTGIVQIYPLKVLQEGGFTNERWYVAGVDGGKSIEVVNTLSSAIAAGYDTTLAGGVVNTNTATQSVIHSFVAFKNLGNGQYGMTPVRNLNSATSTYRVTDTFTVQKNVPGRVNIGSGTILGAGEETELFVLNGHKVDGVNERVSSYVATQLDGYKSLDNITVENDSDETCDGHVNEHIAVKALFISDPDTNMIKTAYIFAEDTPVPAGKDFYILLSRSESDMDGYTDFNFIHNGKLETLRMKKTVAADLQLGFNDALDAHMYPVVTVHDDDFDGAIDRIVPIGMRTPDTTNVAHLDDVTVFYVDSKGSGYIMQDDVAPSGATTGNGTPFYFADGWYVFDQSTGKVLTGLETGDLVGLDVYVFYVDSNMKNIGIIWVKDPWNSLYN